MPLNPPLSHTLQKQRQPEDTTLEDSDSVSLDRDVIFTFANLPDPRLANPFTLKGKGQELPSLQGDDRDGRDSDPSESGNPDSR